MEDYPRTILELHERFPDDNACRDYLMRLRWPDGSVCPRCGAEEAWSAGRGRLVCRGCRYQASGTAGTIFQGTRKPLRLWFHAIWQVTSQKSGTSAVSVQQALGLGSYLTAWTWLHKLRRAMVRRGRERLRGRVEVDETQVGTEENDGGNDQGESSVLVVIATEGSRENRDGDRLATTAFPDFADRLYLSLVMRSSAKGEVLSFR